MLVNTNDAFTGLDSVKLRGGTHVYEVGAYDAGTEVNNESASHIPGLSATCRSSVILKVA